VSYLLPEIGQMWDFRQSTSDVYFWHCPCTVVRAGDCIVWMHPATKSTNFNQSAVCWFLWILLVATVYHLCCRTTVCHCCIHA